MTDTAKSHDGGSSGWIVALGVLLVLTGIGAVAFPLIISLSVEILVGSACLVAGVFTIIHAFSAKEWGGFFWELLIGGLYAFAGVVFLINPFGGVIALTFALGCMFFAEGIMRTILAFRVKPAENWGWVFASGCMSILIGILIIAGLANGASLAFIGLLVGINFIFAGMSFIMIGAGYGQFPVAKTA